MQAVVHPALPPSGRRTRVLIVDDSIVARTMLARTLEAHADFEVVGMCGSGGCALSFMAVNRADVILLDLEMPGMTGLEVLPELIELAQGARVLIVSGACRDGALASIQALQLGATDTLLKPAAGGLAGGFANELTDRLRRLVNTPAADPRPRPRLAETHAVERPEPAGRIACLGIGASTGGVHALAAFFAAYPRTATAPILVTQHLPPPFMPYFARQLEEMAQRPAFLAASGMTVKPGSILLAPGDGHLGLVRVHDQVHVRIERGASASGCMPSVDPMLSAIARVYGAGGAGVMLSGMGRDGVIGADLLVKAGGRLLAQDSASSVVWGMPGTVANAGLCEAVLPPRKLAERIAPAAVLPKD